MVDGSRVQASRQPGSPVVRNGLAAYRCEMACRSDRLAQLPDVWWNRQQIPRAGTWDRSFTNAKRLSRLPVSAEIRDSVRCASSSRRRRIAAVRETLQPQSVSDLTIDAIQAARGSCGMVRKPSFALISRRESAAWTARGAMAAAARERVCETTVTAAASSRIAALETHRR